MTGGADVAMAGADEMSGGADVTMAEAGEGAPAGGQGAAQGMFRRPNARGSSQGEGPQPGAGDTRHLQRGRRAPCVRQQPAAGAGGPQRTTLGPRCRRSCRRRGVHNVHKAKYHTGLRLQREPVWFNQSWTEISNANFIRIVPSSTRILYIVPRTGVFTTYTKLNRGLRLRLQRGPELDGDLEREPVSSVAVLRLLQQVVVVRTERTEDDAGITGAGSWALPDLDYCRAR